MIGLRSRPKRLRLLPHTSMVGGYVRVLQRGEIVAKLTDIERQGDKLTALWLGPPPDFEPDEQLEAWVLETEDGFRREEGIWLYRIWERGEGRARVELGSEEGAPPWRRASTAPAAGPEAEDVARAARPRRVLVVDDDRETLETVVEALKTEGWDVLAARSGREAIELAASRTPDVAVIDLIMPEMSGQEVCLAMRRDPKLRGTRLLVLSAAEDTRVAAAESDADGAITKPFTVGLLLSEVRRLLGP